MHRRGPVAARRARSWSSSSLKSADVLVENFRPGTLERWGLGWDVLHAANPRLVLARVTGFGQSGPYSSRAGFGTLAEAMSGFAAVTGRARCPADASRHGPRRHPRRAHRRRRRHDGAVAPGPSGWIRSGSGHRPVAPRTDAVRRRSGTHGPPADGALQPRTGNRSSSNAPRNTYLTADGRWLAISTSATSIAERVMRLVGLPEVTEKDWFAVCVGPRRARRPARRRRGDVDRPTHRGRSGRGVLRGRRGRRARVRRR